MKNLLIIQAVIILAMSPLVSREDNFTNNCDVERYLKLKEAEEQERLKIERNTFKVSATIYHAEAAQCDADYHITADGSIIDTLNASKHRWIAVSRDMLKYWGGPLSFGDTVLIEGTNSKLDGLHTIHDVMNARFTYKIDFLVSKDDIYGRWDEIKIVRINL